MHFFDGFQVSHEVSNIHYIPQETLKALYPFEALKGFASSFSFSFIKINFSMLDSARKPWTPLILKPETHWLVVTLTSNSKKLQTNITLLAQILFKE